VRAGLRDIENGVESIEALLVQVGAPRLQALGFDVPHTTLPEHKLYDKLAAENPDTAHSRYNALLRRLTSFERAAECVSA